MEVLEVKGMSELAKHILSNVTAGKSVVLYTYYENAVDLVKSLLLHPEIILKHAEIWDGDWDGYDREYMIKIGPYYDLYISKAMHIDEKTSRKLYWNTTSDIVYLDEDAHSLILSSIEGNPELFEVHMNHVEEDFTKYDHNVEQKEECDFCCDRCCDKHHECDLHADFFREMESSINYFAKANDLFDDESADKYDSCDDRDEIEIHVYFNGKELSNANPKRGYFDFSELLNYLVG